MTEHVYSKAVPILYNVGCFTLGLDLCYPFLFLQCQLNGRNKTDIVGDMFQYVISLIHGCAQILSFIYL